MSAITATPSVYLLPVEPESTIVCPSLTFITVTCFLILCLPGPKPSPPETLDTARLGEGSRAVQFQAFSNSFRNNHDFLENSLKQENTVQGARGYILR